jgi:hypothetical protein
LECGEGAGEQPTRFESCSEQREVYTADLDGAWFVWLVWLVWLVRSSTWWTVRSIKHITPAATANATFE